MSKNLADLAKKLNKGGFTTKMNDPTHWVSTGNYALNYRLTGRFDVGICNRRSTMLWGESGTGKTFLSSNTCKEIQDAGYAIVYLDTEDSISEEYMAKVGIDLSPEKFLPILVDTLEEAEKALVDIWDYFGADGKFCLVIDSLGGLLTQNQQDNFDKGASKGDQGQFAKKLKLFIKNVNKKISKSDAYCIMVTHAYQNQDLLNGEGKWICSGGKGFQFFPSFSILLEKANLKESKDDRVDTAKELKGVRIRGTVTKTRFTAPKQKFELNVPYEVGINPYDGVLEVLKEDNLVIRSGAWYSFHLNGEEIKFQAKTIKSVFPQICEMVNQLNGDLEEADDDEVNEELAE